MRRITAGIVIIIIILSVLLISRFRPFRTGNKVFYVENTDRISRILISGEKKSVELYRSQDGWHVNGEYPVRPGAMDFLLSTIRNIRIKSPVSDILYSDIIENKSTRHIEVQVYKKRRLVQSFHIYLNMDEEYPGIMQKSERTKPFTMHLPGYDTDPCLHFVPESKFWMPLTVFDLRPERISEIHMHYFESPDSSFSLVRHGGEIKIISEEHPGVAADTMAAVRYFSYFTWVPMQEWVYDIAQERKDSIVDGKRYFSLEVITGDPDTLELSTYTMMRREGDSLVNDTDRLWGSLNRGEDLFIVRYYDLDPLIKGPSYFIYD